jgi:hypothetical protein
MGCRRFSHCFAVFIAVAVASGNPCIVSAEEEEDDWAAARKASCTELSDAHKTTVEAERKVVAAIRESTTGTVATNVLGVTTLTLLGVGFFTWDNDESAEENLADLRNDLKIIDTVASEKGCKLAADEDPAAK